MSLDYAKTMLKIWVKNFKKLETRDLTAKAKGQLVNRYIQEPYADGYAFYEITKETKTKVHIKVISGLGDNWVIPYWGNDAVIDKSYAMNSIQRRDSLKELFS